jgi:hypothetical protein
VAHPLRAATCQRASVTDCGPPLNAFLRCCATELLTRFPSFGNSRLGYGGFARLSNSAHCASELALPIGYLDLALPAEPIQSTTFGCASR